MKSLHHKLALAGILAFGVAVSPTLIAQTADQTTNTKSLNSSGSANNSSSTTGGPSTAQTDNPVNSKDVNGQTLDKNPSTTPTGSDTTAATKNPSDANTPETKTASGDSKPMHHSAHVSDKDFLCKAAQGGMTEVQLGKLAQEKASSPDVKQFGSRMVSDHAKADDQLKALAEKKGVTVPMTLDAKDQATVDKFQNLSGPAFDKAYVSAMVKDHEKDAKEFRAESTNAQDPDVKAFASDTLKVIESHLSDIKSIQSSEK